MYINNIFPHAKKTRPLGLSDIFKNVTHEKNSNHFVAVPMGRFRHFVRTNAE